MKENTENENENEKNPLKKEEDENIEFFLKEKKDIQNNIKKEENKDEVNHSNNLYEKQDEHLRKLFYQQRHLFEHKKDRKDPLINIYSKHLKEEYINEVNYIWRNSILTIILSTLIIVQNYLILKNFKLYTEIIICFFTGFFAIFLASLLMIELFRNALRDQLRYKLFKMFSIFLSITLLFLFVFQIKNMIVIYQKIKHRSHKRDKEIKNIGLLSLLMNLFGKNDINNIILILGYISVVGIILLIKFQIWLGYNFIKFLCGELEVFQKQILEDKKEDKENLNNINKDKELHQKQD